MHPKEIEWFKAQLKDTKTVAVLSQHIKPIPSKMNGPDFIRFCRHTTLGFDDAQVDIFYGLMVEEGWLHLVAEDPKTYEFSQKMLDAIDAHKVTKQS